MSTRSKKQPTDKKSEGRGLSDRQEKFCQEYARCLVGAEAARRAGYSERSIYAISSELLANPKIRERLATIADLAPDKIINEIAGIATARFTDIAEYTQNGLVIKPSNELCDRAKAAIKSVEFNEVETKEKTTRSIKVVMHEKSPALEKLMRLFKLYPSEYKVLDAVNVLMEEKIISEEHAKTVKDGVEQITQNLKSVSQRTQSKPE